MKLDRTYQYRILCEDKQTQAFVKHFLQFQGISPHNIRAINIPGGKGSGESYVRKHFRSEVSELRRRSYNKNVLLVCTDADSLTVDNRIQLLMSEISDKPMHSNEFVMFWIPKREIETWIYELQGRESINESDKYHHDKPIKCRRESEKMSRLFQEKNAVCRLPSMQNAKVEYDRICKMQ